MFRAIALGGGGVRGYLLLGALKELSKHQPLEFPKGLYGCSIGSILATALAYRIPIDRMESMLRSVSISDLTPPVRLATLLDATKTKGLHSMDAMETLLMTKFREEGVDLQDATLADAPQPLHIVASNLTRCTPTIFEGSVRILDAIKASCAIPGFFQPQILYDSVYVDGGLYVPSIIDILPLELRDSALVLNLSRPKRGIKPADLESLPPWSYMYRMYQTSVEYRLRISLTPNSVWLQNETTNSMDHLSDAAKTELVTSGARQFATFWSKLPNEPIANPASLDGSVVVNHGGRAL